MHINNKKPKQYAILHTRTFGLSDNAGRAGLAIHKAELSKGTPLDGVDEHNLVHPVVVHFAHHELAANVRLFKCKVVYEYMLCIMLFVVVVVQIKLYQRLHTDVSVKAYTGNTIQKV